MNIVAELLAKPGVIAAGHYAYRGDRFSYKGSLSEEDARRASIMCRATTMSTIMEGEMLAGLRSQSGIHPVRGWAVRGADNSVCVVANVFCFVANEAGSVGGILKFMRDSLAGQTGDLV
jgi:roadblock/LC7 domain-containing protein